MALLFASIIIQEKWKKLQSCHHFFNNWWLHQTKIAHPNQQDFFARVKDKYPEYFKDKKVLECGSLNVNGTFRTLFENCDYTGIDIVGGKDVDMVSLVHEIPFEDKSFDIVVSGEMLEHDEHWQKSLQKMYDVLKDGGIMIISCAGQDRPEHGTTKTGAAIWGTSNDYYMNLTPTEFQSIFKEGMFKETHYEEATDSKDTYFYGIK